MAWPLPTTKVEVKLAGVWTDISADLTDAPIVLRHGIQSSSPEARIAEAGQCTFTLNNQNNSAMTLGYYSPRHAAVRAGWRLGIECRVTITDPTTATAHVRHIGRLDAILPVPGLYGERVVHVTSVDWMDEAARWALTTAVGVQVDQTWDTIAAAIVAAMPSPPPGGVVFEAGTESFPFALDTSVVGKQKARDEFGKISRSEFGKVWVTAAGGLYGQNRHTPMLDRSSDWTLSDTEFDDLELPSTRNDIINVVRVTGHPKTVGVDIVALYSLPTPLVFVAGETKTVDIAFRDPSTGDAVGGVEVQTLDQGEGDYAAFDNAGGTGIDLSADFTFVVTPASSGLTAAITYGGAGTAYLTALSPRGRPIYDRGTIVRTATDATSVADNGENPVDFDMPYQGNLDVLQAAADYILAKFKDPLAQARAIVVRGRSTASLTQILTRDIGDRISIAETVTGVDDAFFVNGIELTVDAMGYVEARYILTPAQDPYSSYFQLDVSELDGADVVAPF